jgi:hypothetical protein
MLGDYSRYVEGTGSDIFHVTDVWCQKLAGAAGAS